MKRSSKVSRRVPILVRLAAGATAAVMAWVMPATPAAAMSDVGGQQARTSDVQPMSVATGCWFTSARGRTYLVTGNWDGIGGDGVGTVAPDRNGDLFWQLRNGPNGGPADYSFTYGRDGDLPVVGNWDGIGGDGIGAVRREDLSLRWFMRNGPNAGLPEWNFLAGSSTAFPVTGNWDGIGGDGIGWVSTSSATWYVNNSPYSGAIESYFDYSGGIGGWPVTGNWDGAGGDGPGLALSKRGPNRTGWALRNGPNGGAPDYAFDYGTANGCPVTGNWDGIGGDGIGIVYPRSDGSLQWHLRQGPNPGVQEIDFHYGVVCGCLRRVI